MKSFYINITQQDIDNSTDKLSPIAIALERETTIKIRHDSQFFRYIFVRTEDGQGGKVYYSKHLRSNRNNLKIIKPGKYRMRFRLYEVKV